MKTWFLRLSLLFALAVILWPPVVVERWTTGDEQHPTRLAHADQQWLPIFGWDSGNARRTRPDFPKLIYALLASTAAAAVLALIVPPVLRAVSTQPLRGVLWTLAASALLVAPFLIKKAWEDDVWKAVERERERTALMKAENDILRARLAQILKVPAANSSSRFDPDEFLRRVESDYWHQVESEMRGSASKFSPK